VTRRFVALRIAPELRETLEPRLAALRDAHPELSWTDPQGWHVTLAFIGELPDERAAAVVDAVRAAVVPGSGPRTVEVGGGARLGGALVLRVGDAPVGWVAELGARIQRRLEEAGLPVQVRELRPHLTLARARRGRRIPDELIAEVDAVVADAPYALAFAPHAVGVWTSHPRQGPARYEVEAEVPLLD
jgi:RNA 2',3'-cyclic 3'-phosphodiesterase